MKVFSSATKGVCSNCIRIAVDGDEIKDVHFFQGCPGNLGSGSHENGRSFKVVAIEKKVQTSIMHEQSVNHCASWAEIGSFNG